MTLSAYKQKSPVHGDSVYIHESAIVIGNVYLADDVSVWPMTVVRADVHSIAIGAASNIQDGCVLHVTHDGHYAPGGYALVIGEGVTVGHRAILHGCTIGCYCLIGIGCIVMDGAILENEVMLGAGSLVPPGKHLRSGYLYVGTPAKQVRELSENERAFLRYSSSHYVRLKNDYLQASKGA